MLIGIEAKSEATRKIDIDHVFSTEAQLSIIFISLLCMFFVVFQEANHVLNMLFVSTYYPTTVNIT